MVKQLNFFALHAITNWILNSNKFLWELFLFFAWLFLARNCDMLYQITTKSATHIMFYWFRLPNFLVWDDGMWVAIRGKFSILFLIAPYCSVVLLYKPLVPLYLLWIEKDLSDELNSFSLRIHLSLVRLFLYRSLHMQGHLSLLTGWQLFHQLLNA